MAATACAEAADSTTGLRTNQVSVTGDTIQGLGSLSELQQKRAAWVARGITDYRFELRISCFCAGDITLDERQMRVSVRGVPVTMSPLEYRLVTYLLRHRGRVVSQHELDENVYGHGEDHDSNALEVLIGRVRKKLGPDLIETRRGFGYIVPEPPA